MTDYSDVPKANTLHQEREMVSTAIDYIDGGGAMTSLVVAPPKSDTPMPQMAVTIATAGTPIPPATMSNIRTWLVQRTADIDAELTSLGVTNSPAKKG